MTIGRHANIAIPPQPFDQFRQQLLVISPNKTAKLIKTKLVSVFLCCQSYRYKTAIIKILSADF